MNKEEFVKRVLEILRDMEDAIDVICNLDVDVVLDKIKEEGDL